MPIPNNTLNKWLDLISNKQTFDIKLSDELSNAYNKQTKLNYIISFDVEFLKYFIKGHQYQTIREMGGLILEKRLNEWFLICIFHFNLSPLIKNINQYYLVTTTYATISDETYKKANEIEKQLLPEYNYELLESKKYLSNNKIQELLELKKTDFDKFIKRVGKIKHSIKGDDLIKYKKDYNLFKELINLILNDPDTLDRQINIDKQNLFINLTNELFSNSLLIIKGMEDIKSLKNHTLLLKQKSINIKYMFDIAKYNDLLFKKCNSAELEKTYICLAKLNFTNKYSAFLKIIEDFTNLKAHNPLVDAYYTWIIFNIFIIEKNI